MKPKIICPRMICVISMKSSLMILMFWFFLKSPTRKKLESSKDWLIMIFALYRGYRIWMLLKTLTKFWNRAMQSSSCGRISWFTFLLRNYISKLKSLLCLRIVKTNRFSWLVISSSLWLIIFCPVAVRALIYLIWWWRV